jgi:hypothetical protein
MPKFTDYYSDPEVKSIMERFIEHFPGMFEGFNVDNIHVVFTKKKKARRPIRLIPVRYPQDVFICKPYIIEVFEAWWEKMTPKQKNLAIFHVMCAVPEGGFDEQSSHYAKKVRPDVEMYLREYCAAGGVPNWLENDAAKDPMEQEPKEVAIAVSLMYPKEEGEKDIKGDTDDDADDAIPDPAKASKPKKVARIPVTKEAIANVGV